MIDLGFTEAYTLFSSLASLSVSLYASFLVETNVVVKNNTLYCIFFYFILSLSPLKYFGENVHTLIKLTSCPVLLADFTLG